MAEISDIMIEKLAKAILRAANTQQMKKPEPCTADAEVLRVENGTAYVHITGGAPETPARVGIACHTGDNVQVRLENGKASLAGNPSSPPTDDTKAKEAAQLAKAAGEAADEAQKTADNIKQYFWFMNGKGSEAGAHVTEVPRAEFQKKPQGGNLLLRSNSVKLRMALITLAELVATGLKIYEPGDSTNPIAQFLGTAAVIGKETGYNVRTAAQQLQFWNNGTLLGYITGAAPAPGLHLMDEGWDASYFTPGSIRLMDIKNNIPQGRTNLMAPDEDGDNILRAADGNDTELVDIYYDKPNGKAHMDLSGNITADGKGTFGALNSGLFLETTETLLSNTAISSQGVSDGEKDITGQGYPLAICGIYSSTRYFVTTQYDLKNKADGSATIDYMVYNPSGSSRTGTVQAKVLWLKTLA